MLVLARKKEEAIFIEVGGERIEVKIVDIERYRVKIGFNASKNVTILREEVRRK